MAKPWLSCGLVVASLCRFDVTHPQAFGRIQSGSWGSVLAHVGIMAQGGLKLPPRWLKIALCWLKLVPRRSTWPFKESEVLQDETPIAFEMASTSICFGFLVIFSRFACGPTFSNESVLFVSFESINFGHFLDQISMNFRSFLSSEVVYAPRGLKIPS